MGLVVCDPLSEPERKGPRPLSPGPCRFSNKFMAPALANGDNLVLVAHLGHLTYRFDRPQSGGNLTFVGGFRALMFVLACRRVSAVLTTAGAGPTALPSPTTAHAA